MSDQEEVAQSAPVSEIGDDEAGRVPTRSKLPLHTSGAKPVQLSARTSTL